MRKGNLTREQAIAIVGEAAVDKVDAENCDFTNRVGYNGSMQGDDEVEFSASLSCEDKNGYEVSLIAYYYLDADTLDKVDGLDEISEWEIEGYEVI